MDELAGGIEELNMEAGERSRNSSTLQRESAGRTRAPAKPAVTMVSLVDELSSFRQMTSARFKCRVLSAN